MWGSGEASEPMVGKARPSRTSSGPRGLGDATRTGPFAFCDQCGLTDATMTLMKLAPIAGQSFDIIIDCRQEGFAGPPLSLLKIR